MYHVTQHIQIWFSAGLEKKSGQMGQKRSRKQKSLAVNAKWILIHEDLLGLSKGGHFHQINHAKDGFWERK